MTGRDPGHPEAALPLAPGQELLWEFMTALCPHDPTGAREVVAGTRRLHGPVDPDVFRAAVGDVVARHDMLRLVFVGVGPDPLVRVRPRIEPPVTVVDLADQSEAERWDQIESLVYAERQRTFALTSGPLWRVCLIRLTPTDHVLAYSFCHLVADGWAARVFVEEVVHAYRARLGWCPPLAGRPPSFAETSALQRRELGDPHERAEYWRRHLTPLPPYLPFPAREVAPDADVAAESGHRFAFSAEVCHDLRRLAWRARTTVFVVLLAAWHVLIARRTGSARVVISTTTLGRRSAVAKAVIGQFTFDVCVPVRIRPDVSLVATVVDVHQALTAALANVLPYRDLAAAVNPGFARDRPWPDNHLFDSYFQAAEPASPELVFPELRVEQVWVDGRAAPGTPPSLVAADVPADRRPIWVKRGSPIVVVDDDRRGGVMLHNPHFFADELVSGLVADYVAIVDGLAREPARHVADVVLPTGPDRAPVATAAGRRDAGR